MHWLHYGRGGHGYAVGIDFSSAEMGGWSLVPVIYRKEAQCQILEGIYDRIQDDVATALEGQPNSDIEFIAGCLMAHMTGFIAPCFKDPCFAAEEEWRLFRPCFKEQRSGTPPFKYRTAGSLIVPYIDFSLKRECIQKVVMGYQVPDYPTRQSVKMLLESCGIDPDRCMIENSKVPVRGTT
jgi:hypothetical protein